MLDNTENIENVENRECNENSACVRRPLPNIPIYSYKFTNNESAVEAESCEEKMETRRQMINKIRSLQFAIVELAQYLDTHPTDEKALCLHKEYANALHDLKEEYQKKYGPLTINFP